MTLQKRLEHLCVRDGDIVKFRGKSYVFERDDWFFGSLRGIDLDCTKVISPSEASNLEVGDHEQIIILRTDSRL